MVHGGRSRKKAHLGFFDGTMRIALTWIAPQKAMFITCKFVSGMEDHICLLPQNSVAGELFDA